uniref:PT26-6P n=1 Tax=Thermococcus sp. 26-2 TaxID=195518 RepID=UPI000194EC42
MNATINDDDIDDVKKALDHATQAAHKAAAELTAKLRSDFVEYGNGGTAGQVLIHIYGPGLIYGFSAFPVQIRLEIPNQPVPFNKVHITEVTAYVIDENNRTYWTRVWNSSTFRQGGYIADTLDLVTVMKAPDPLVYQIRDAIVTGQISRELYDKIWNTSTTHFEIRVIVKGYQEAWKTDSSVSNQSSCPSDGHWYEDACWVHDKDIDFTLKAETTTAWGHVTGTNDVATIDGGMLGSLPIKFLQSLDLSGKWVLYQNKYAGALSDFIIITAASPVHVLNSTAMYKFLITPNPGYFQPANPKISDEYRFVTLRVIEGGRMELADTTTGHIGDLTEPTFFGLTAHYTDAPGTLDYHALGLVYAYVERDDGVKIPIWLAAEPMISVLSNTYTVMKDQDVKNLIDLYKKKDREKINATTKAMINSLQEKIDEAEQLLAKAKGMNNENAIEYAQGAIDEYKAAINDLQKAAQQDDYQMFLNYLNAAKKHEMAGDYYVNAARKALNGDLEQAKIDAEKAKEYSNLAKEYEPG